MDSQNNSVDNSSKMGPKSERTKKWIREHPEQHARNMRRYYMKKLYGITLAEYDKMLANQDEKCAICRMKCSTGRRLAVDHDHDTGKVRGLLCNKCNRGLGYMPTIELLTNSIMYLKEGA